MKKRITTLCVILAVPILAFGGLYTLWYRGGNEASTYFSDINTGKPSSAGPRLFYRGIDIPFTMGKIVLFKRYYSIVWKEPYTDLTSSVLYSGDGYNFFFIFYESGKLAGTGSCLVETQENGQILHDIYDVELGTYYLPDGTTVSNVEKGTGVIKLFYSDGSKYAELELDNYQRKYLKIWSRDGKLKQDKVYENHVNPVNPV